MQSPPKYSLACILLAGVGIATTIEKDVVIIGGGAAGVYAATQFRSIGLSFAVIEKKAQFGGQTETYTIPGTNTTIDYGVEGYTPLVNESYDVVQQFFATYNVPTTFLTRSETGSGTTRYFDFSTAQELTNFTVNTDLTAWATQADKYPWNGYQIQTPTPIPGDLVLSFGEFIEKYSLQSYVYNIFSNVEGLGDVLSLPAYYVLRELNAAHLLALSPSSQGLVVTGRNQDAYLNAQAQFGTDAMVNSTVQSAERDGNGVTLTVEAPSGLTTIRASKLLIAMPIIPANMDPLGLDGIESGLFNKFSFNGFFAALVNATGFQAGQSFQNAFPDTLYNLPPLPAVYAISTTHVAGIYLVRYGALGTADIAEVQAAIISSVSKIRAAAVSNAASLAPVELLAFANHQPYNLHVNASELKAGFNNQLGALQGHRSTWYSGAAIFGSSSSDIWNGTQSIVESMVAWNGTQKVVRKAL